ncbi:PREDICTED: exoglucanase A-like, partial [Poecilia mexicana]|uniref:exoglucanase A-like n=1 Tax=Poecilia mexicana TaxID=48701 RepID=UPI00072E0233
MKFHLRTVSIQDLGPITVDMGRMLVSSVQPTRCNLAYCAEIPLFIVLTQSETSITLQWSAITTSFVLQYDGTETNINAPDGAATVTYTVSSLTAGTIYTFTLYTVIGNGRNSGQQLTAVTAPQNTGGFTNSAQDESSITLQWNKINISTSFVLQYDGIETNINAPDGDGPVIHTVSSLTAGTKYTFTLFSVFESIRSSGVQLTAVTTPQNAEGFTNSGQNESSITLQWNKINNNGFVLQYDGIETNINAPDGDGPVMHTVSSLTAGTRYTFTLFSVFEGVRSSGVQLTAVT